MGQITQRPPLSAIVKSRRLSLFAHVARMDTTAHASRTTPGKLEKTTGASSPRSTWIRNISDDLSLFNTELTDAAQNQPFNLGQIDGRKKTDAVTARRDQRHKRHRIYFNKHNTTICGHYIGQTVLIPVTKCRILLEQRFTACMLMLMAHSNLEKMLEFP